MQIAAFSQYQRSCPVVRNNKINNDSNCKNYCKHGFTITPESEIQKKSFPKIELLGNVLFNPEFVKPSWDGYSMLIFYKLENLKKIVSYQML